MRSYYKTDYDLRIGGNGRIEKAVGNVTEMFKIKNNMFKTIKLERY